MKILTPFLNGPHLRSVLFVFSFTCFLGVASAQEWPSEPKTVKGEEIEDRLKGAWGLTHGVAARNALRDGDVPSARAALRRLAAADPQLADPDANESLLLIELMESRTVKSSDGAARSLVRDALSRQSSKDPEAMFLRATALTDYLGDGQKAVELYRRIVSGYTGRNADLSTAESLTEAYKRAIDRGDEPSGYQRRAYGRLLKVLALRESSTPSEAAELPSVVEGVSVGEGEGNGMEGIVGDVLSTPR